MVDKVVRKFPFTYYLKDLLGFPIEGICYREELKPVSLPKTFAIEKILKREIDKTTGKLRYLVRWDGYPPHFDSYIYKLEKLK